MPDPRKLKVGDKVKFVALPEEWNVPGYHVHPDSVTFMKAMIARTWPSRVCRIHEDGYPWIQARMKDGDSIAHHEWGIYESTGWRLVRRRLYPVIRPDRKARCFNRRGPAASVRRGDTTGRKLHRK